MFISKHLKKVKIIHSPSKSIKPIFNLCRLNAQQIINNHISKEDKYSFAIDEIKKYLNMKILRKLKDMTLVIYLEIMQFPLVLYSVNMEP